MLMISIVGRQEMGYFVSEVLLYEDITYKDWEGLEREANKRKETGSRWI